MNKKLLISGVIAAGTMAMCGQSAVAAAADSHPAGISADIKGFGRDWQQDGWRALRTQQPPPSFRATYPVEATRPISAPELGSSLAASALGLLVGALAAARGRRAS